MKISVIILNWNRRNDVLRAVTSLQPVLRPGDEALVWDNGSSDESVAALRTTFSNWPALHILESDQNIGVCRSRNEAARVAKGDVLLFMDSDAELVTQDAAERIEQRLSDDQQTVAINFEIRRPDGRALWPFHRDQTVWSRKEFPITRIDGCGFAIRKSAFTEAGGFPEHFGYGAEEHYLARRLIGLGYEVVYFPEVAVIHHQAPSGRTTDQFSTMMRNHIWMPLELFRMPWAAASALRMMAVYGRDAWRERRLRNYLRGLWWTARDFRWSRRRPLSRPAWRRYREIIHEDRRHGA